MKKDHVTQQLYYEEHPLDDYPVGIGGNSWYLKVPLSTCRNLFLDACNYQVHAYACKCGKERVFISDNSVSHLSYVCSRCDNNGFLDVAQLDLYGEYSINIDTPAEYAIEGDKAIARVFVSVPKSVDLARGERVIYEKKKIFEIEKSLVTIDETVYSGWEKVSTDALAKVEHNLLYYIGEHHLKESMHDYDTLRIKQRSFPQLRKAILWFLKYPEFKHSEFFLWVMDDDLYYNGGIEKSPIHFLEYIRSYRTEKSIKRTLYKRYQQELTMGKFHPITPYIICRVFTDPNNVVKMLDNYNFIFTWHSNYQSLALCAASHIRLIEFLKESYSEKQIVNMFENMGDSPEYWEDSVQMFNNLFYIEQISEHFTLPRANVREIHDELVRSRYLTGSNHKLVEFSYTKIQLKPCGVWEKNFQIVLPQTSDELYLWSKHLHNCLYGYIDSVYEHDTTIYGVKEGNVLMYAIEIQNGSLIQMKGAYNTEPNEEIKKSLNRWYQHYFGTKLEEK